MTLGFLNSNRDVLGGACLLDCLQGNVVSVCLKFSEVLDDYTFTHHQFVLVTSFL